MIRLLISLLLAVNLATAFAGNYSKLVIFGDSLSDTNNLATVTQPFPNPPYHGNRITNGLVSVEVLAKYLRLPLEPSNHLIGVPTGSNYAVAGAKANGNEPIDLETQVNAYLQRFGGKVDPKALYVFFIGGNDIRSARSIEDYKTAINFVEDAADIVGEKAKLFVQLGARNVAFVNSPNIGDIPETRLLSAGSTELQQLANNLTYYYNKQLERNALSIYGSDRGLNIRFVDINSVFRSILAYAIYFGFENSTDACFSSATHQLAPNCNFDRFIFFDEIHPTARVHELSGITLYSRLR
ncbi:MAG: SGNH/GDSL hydrolase family protein [Pseudomonadota bacterium]